MEGRLSSAGPVELFIDDEPVGRAEVLLTLVNDDQAGAEQGRRWMGVDLAGDEPDRTVELEVTWDPRCLDRLAADVASFKNVSISEAMESLRLDEFGKALFGKLLDWQARLYLMLSGWRASRDRAERERNSRNQVLAAGYLAELHKLDLLDERERRFEYLPFPIVEPPPLSAVVRIAPHEPEDS
ncbi:hypothetical protein [Singulisphaera sp. PoT]|uniref:hypothetical protein n=1 Tax=Singulisphaera sp. PoT TaxID=3411797 RepID=UPI003BF491E2